MKAYPAAEKVNEMIDASIFTCPTSRKLYVAMFWLTNWSHLYINKGIGSKLL